MLNMRSGDTLPAARKMAGNRNLSSTALGLCLLPSELLHDIFLRLALPEILRLKCVSRGLDSLVSSKDFGRIYNQQSVHETWVFIYKKRSARDSTLRGFSDRSGRWFKAPIAGSLLLPVVPPGEDLYFLTASGDFFLFVSNNRRELIAVNLTKRSARKIPASPLGPRGTSSWRRSGLKLVLGPPGSDAFHFLFAELHENRPFLLYNAARTPTWQSKEAVDEPVHVRSGVKSRKPAIFLSVVHRRRESVILGVSPEGDPPVVYRPRFGGGVEEGSAVGLASSGATDRLHVYGDGRMAVIRSDGGDENIGGRIFRSVEILGLGGNHDWELISAAPEGLIERIRKPYGVMMGCVEERDGVIRVILLSNYKGSWDLIWLCYETERRKWRWVPVPDCGTRGLNMGGIALSSGPRLSSSMS